MPELVTTFARESDYRAAAARLDALGLPYRAICPSPAYALVGVPALVLEDEVRLELARRGGQDLNCAGWVTFCPEDAAVPEAPAPSFAEDIFGRAAIMVLPPCIADPRKIRLIAHVSGDISSAFPYLNAKSADGCYSPAVPGFSFMDGHRLVSLYARRITVAKANGIVDAWRTLEAVRQRVNGVWARRAQIEPSYEQRTRPPALEIFRRLPQTDCRLCGELTCLAFALMVHAGLARVSRCRPAFEGAAPERREALLEICRALGVEQ
jgi:ArsR family metal-binding transcriptional regulator